MPFVTLIVHLPSSQPTQIHCYLWSGQKISYAYLCVWQVITELIFSQPRLILFYFSSQFQGGERSKSGDFIKVGHSPFLLVFVYLIWGQNCILTEELVNLIRVLRSNPDCARTDFAKGLVKSSSSYSIYWVLCHVCPKMIEGHGALLQAALLQ